MNYVLLDIAGLALTAEDQEILQHPAVFGVILFARNYQNPRQLRELTESIHRVNSTLCITVDQEGGRVQRFKESFTLLPSMREWGLQYERDREQAVVAFKTMLKTMVTELKSVGVQATLMPVLDVDYGVSQIIGERSFGRDVTVVTQLANIAVDVLHQYGMPATGKHFPGHGAVVLDSHEQLPIDEREFEQIWQNDLVPYQKLVHCLDAIMPAHIIYPAIDDKPAGFSRIWLQEILRQRLGFTGLIMSDDITMKAAHCFGDYVERAHLAWEAGCNVVTVCNYRPGAIAVLESAASG
ncbi:MAG: beta-N-acetylhexosaminidase [Coxiella sp. RIFCSPHIGHO2_12_FULL_42_15]|nr:MAG: beta-N-acetylhexosaminidase [Coxiella sp. RIFCSPHIGHO2_12_FULL_42_15]